MRLRPTVLKIVFGTAMVFIGAYGYWYYTTHFAVEPAHYEQPLPDVLLVN